MKTYTLLFAALLMAQQVPSPPPAIVIDYPEPGSVFPPDITAPTFLIRDPATALAWRIDDRSPAPEERADPHVPPDEWAAVPAGGPPVEHLAEVLALLLGHLGELGQLSLGAGARGPHAVEVARSLTPAMATMPTGQTSLG